MGELDKYTSEESWQQTLIALLHAFHFKVAHFRPARVMIKGQETYRTPVSADGKGFPDILAARKGRLVAIEVKGETGSMTPEQEDWLNVLASAGAETYVARPSDFDYLKEALR